MFQAIKNLGGDGEILPLLSLIFGYVFGAFGNILVGAFVYIFIMIGTYRETL